jgi:A/G-specific adenine glycosylase
MKRFPTLKALANASEDDVLHAWQGLGYYSRARRLREGARVVLDDFGGKLPECASELRAIPGVGRYTAGAISSIAFGKRAPIVDGNVTRVLCRLHGLRGDTKKAHFNRGLWARAEQLLVDGPPSRINQGLMELGATLCTPRAPDCTRCPFAESCVARQRGAPESYPGVQKRPSSIAVTMAGMVLHRRGKVLLVQRPATAARWAGLWQFPTVETSTEEAPRLAAERAARQLAGLGPTSLRRLCVVKHAVTRHRITLTVYEGNAAAGRARPAEGCCLGWYRIAELGNLALPAAHRKIADRLV